MHEERKWNGRFFFEHREFTEQWRYEEFAERKSCIINKHGPILREFEKICDLSDHVFIKHYAT